MKIVLKKANIIAAVLTMLSLTILIWTFYSLATVEVLEDWELTFTEQDIHVGDTVVVQSTYNKLRDASGESIRYITCRNRGHVWVRYELNRATSDRAKGRGGTGIPLTIRRDIADVPTKCKFDIAIRYEGVLPGKDVSVSNSTREFTLLPERVSAERSVTVNPTTTQKSLSQALPSSQYPQVSSSNNTANANPSQSNNVQETNQTPPTSSRSIPLVTPVLNTVTSLYRSTTNVIKEIL